MGTPFDSIPRKLAVPLVALTAVGWLLVVIGFGIATNENNPPDLPRTGSFTYPLWMISICGPFIFIAAIAHAALWQPISSMVGAITSFLSVVFLTALGMGLYSVGQGIRILNNFDEEVADWLALSFAGSLLATLFWTLLMVLWQFYDTSSSEEKSEEAFQGIARKIVIPFILLTGVGWLLVVIGFGIGSNEDDFFSITQTRDDPISYLYWAVCISGPFVLVVAVIHAALWKPISSIVGAVMVLLNGFFLTGLGMILFINGENIRAADEFFVVPAYFALEFAGALLATFFWTPVMMLWHFYDVDQKEE